MGASKTVGTIGYLSAFDGDEALIELQRERVAPLLTSSGSDIGDYVVDVGWPDGGAVCPPGLFQILRASRVRAVTVVAVETVARFARDRATAGRIAAILCDAGVQIREADRDLIGMTPPAAPGLALALSRERRSGARRTRLGQETD